MVSVELFGRKIGAEKLAAAAFLLLALAAPALPKPFVDTFAYGTSYGKLYSFAAYFLALAFASDILRVTGKNRAVAGFFLNIDVRWVAIALAAVFAFGLFGQLYFLNAIGGSYDVKYFAFDGQGYTSTHINHNHALKTSLCPFVPSNDFDCARPMLPFLPPFYQWFGLALFAIAVFTCIAYYPKLHDNADKVAFILLSFSTLKSAVDGGLFNYEAIAFGMFLAYFLVKRHRLAWSAAVAAAWIVALFFVYAYYSPLELALPFLVLFYSVMIVMQKPKVLFPFLIVALVAPTYLISDSHVITGRWQQDACLGAGADGNYTQAVLARTYQKCNFTKEFACGKVVALENQALYEGNALAKPELLLSRALFEGCGNGAFVIVESSSSFRVMRRGG